MYVLLLNFPIFNSQTIQIEGPKWKKDQKLEGKYNGEYYWGHVNQVYKNGNYSFHFDDGDKAKSLSEKEIRERTPIIPINEPDISDSSSESDDEQQDDVNDEVVDDNIDKNSGAYNIEALTTFLTQQMKNYEYFLNGTVTSYGESFHNICNLYYAKGSHISLL